MPEDMVKIEKESHESNLCCEGDYYPYGTELRFEDEMIERLGLGNLAPGDEVEVRAHAFVASTYDRNSVDGEGHKSVEVQLTSIKIKRAESDRAEVLYGSK